MSDDYKPRHLRPATDEPTARLRWALTQRDQLGVTHRRTAEPEEARD